MKKLLLIALLIVGCDRYEFLSSTTRFDKWTGEWEYKHKFEGKYRCFTVEEFNNRYK